MVSVYVSFLKIYIFLLMIRMQLVGFLTDTARIPTGYYTHGNDIIIFCPLIINSHVKLNLRAVNEVRES